MSRIERRYELKLIAPETALGLIRSWVRLSPASFRPTYVPRHVNSIYFDTPGYRNLGENLAGVADRKKLRLRWYGQFHTHVGNPVLEMKIKEGHIGYKKQEKLPCSLDLTQNWHELITKLKTAVSLLFLPLLKQHTQPAIINSYKREYFVTPDGQIRLTLDYDQKVFDQRLSPMPNLKRPLPIEKEIVIELKAPPDQAERLTIIMGRFPLLRSRNSKYVKGMLAGPR